MAPDKFLFVNQTGAADAEASPQAKSSKQAEILSHVQSRRYRAAKWSGYTSKLRATEVPGRKDTSRTGTGGSIHVFSLSDSGDAATQQLSSFNAHLAPLSMTFPTNNASDPFNSTSAQGDVGSHMLLQCAMYMAARPNFNAEAFAPPKVVKNRDVCRHEAILARRLQICVHDETLMYASLAYSACFLTWTMQRPAGHKPPEYFLDKAINSFRRRLAAPDIIIDDWIIMSMHSLAITQLWNGIPEFSFSERERNAKAAENIWEGIRPSEEHFRTLLRFVEASGGWHLFNPYVLDSVMLADKFLATVGSRAPLLTLTWDPGQLPATRILELGLDPNVDAVQLGLGGSLVSACENIELKHIASDIVNFIYMAPLLWAQPTMRAEDEHWLFRRFQALMHQIQAFKAGAISVQDQCLSSAILVFLYSVTCGRGPTSAAGLVARRLEQLLQNEEPLGLEDETLLWCYYVAAMARSDFPKRKWFLWKILQLENPIKGESEILDLFRRHLLVPVTIKHRIRRLRRDLQNFR